MTGHSGEKPNKGIIYGKALSDKGNIQRHMRTHSGEKTYQCTHCEKVFLI